MKSDELIYVVLGFPLSVKSDDVDGKTMKKPWKTMEHLAPPVWCAACAAVQEDA